MALVEFRGIWMPEEVYESGIRLPSRDSLPHFLNALGFVGDGVEVGVQRGEFSARIIDTWNGRMLYCVDAWRHFPDPLYPEGGNASDEEQLRIKRECEERLSLFPDHTRIIHELSVEAAAQFADLSLDFVYIDANHTYEGVREDLEAWYPKVATGGLIGGHDFIDIHDWCRVPAAVIEFAMKYGLKLFFSCEDGHASWFAFKPLQNHSSM